MSLAENRLSVCMHGVQEDVDSHRCAACRRMCQESGCDMTDYSHSHGGACLWTRPPRGVPTKKRGGLHP